MNYKEWAMAFRIFWNRPTFPASLQPSSCNNFWVEGPNDTPSWSWGKIIRSKIHNPWASTRHSSIEYHSGWIRNWQHQNKMGAAIDPKRSNHRVHVSLYYWKPPLLIPWILKPFQLQLLIWHLDNVRIYYDVLGEDYHSQKVVSGQETETRLDHLFPQTWYRFQSKLRFFHVKKKNTAGGGRAKFWNNCDRKN